MKIGPISYLPFTTTKPKAYVKNNSTCPNDSTVASRKVQKIRCRSSEFRRHQS